MLYQHKRVVFLMQTAVVVTIIVAATLTQHKRTMVYNITSNTITIYNSKLLTTSFLLKQKIDLF